MHFAPTSPLTNHLLLPPPFPSPPPPTHTRSSLSGVHPREGILTLAPFTALHSVSLVGAAAESCHLATLAGLPNLHHVVATGFGDYSTRMLPPSVRRLELEVRACPAAAAAATGAPPALHPLPSRPTHSRPAPRPTLPHACSGAPRPPPPSAPSSSSRCLKGRSWSCCASPPSARCACPTPHSRAATSSTSQADASSWACPPTATPPGPPPLSSVPGLPR